VSRAANALGALLVLSVAFAAPPLRAQPVPSPLPSTSAIPTIGRTHSKGFCDTLRDQVAPSLLGLMKNDALLGAEHRAFAKMSHDATMSPGSAALDLDRVYIEQGVHALAHNIAVIDGILSDTKRFPKDPVTDDDKYAALLAAQLRAARDRQNDALNLVNGTVETEQMGQMRSEISTQMQSAVGPSSAPVPASPTEPPNFLDAAGLPDYSPVSLYDPRTMSTSSTLGNGPYDRVVRALEFDQARVTGAEQALTPTIVAAAAGCRDATRSTSSP
jgi:hypothetical protein